MRLCGLREQDTEERVRGRVYFFEWDVTEVQSVKAVSCLPYHNVITSALLTCVKYRMSVVWTQTCSGCRPTGAMAWGLRTEAGGQAPVGEETAMLGKCRALVGEAALAKCARELRSKVQHGQRARTMGMDGGLSTGWMKCDRLTEAEYRWAIRAVAYSLPSPSLMATWKFIVSGKCPMCGDAVADLKHMLSNCVAVLKSQAYTGRHSRVVQVIQEEMRRSGRWSVENGCELRKERRFPETLRRMEVRTTATVPDLVAISVGAEGRRRVLIADVKVKWPGILYQAQQQVEEQYRDIVEDIGDDVDVVGPIAIPVGVTGEILQSWHMMCATLGISGERAETLAASASREAIKGSKKCYQAYWCIYHSFAGKGGKDRGQ